jgi:hypothetical protein
MNFEDFKKVMDEVDTGDDNGSFNTFDIMRNYLDNDAMHSVIEYLISKNFTNINYLILTANNLTDFTFLTRFNNEKICNIQTLILSRNKILKQINLKTEILQ